MTVLIMPVRFAPHVGGIETLLEHILPPIRSRGVEPVIVTGVDDDSTSQDVIDGLHVYRLPFLDALRSYNPTTILGVSRRLRGIEADHAVTLRHVHGLDFNMFFVARRHRLAPLPLVISVHGTLDTPFPFSPITLRMLENADAVTAVSYAVRDSIVEHVPPRIGRVHVIPNAVNAPGDAAPWPEAGHLFCAGRLEEQKGCDVAIDALARLSATRPGLRLHLAGRGSQAQALRRRAERHGIVDRVRFLGVISGDDMRAQIEAASVVLVPSRSIEGFAMIALEAAHLARPVVASRVGGLAETVVDGRTGVLVPPDDSDRLATAIDDLLADPNHAAELGRTARTRASRFDVDACADAYAEIYRELRRGVDVPVLELQGEQTRG